MAKMINLGKIKENGHLNCLFKQTPSKVRNDFENTGIVTVVELQVKL